MLSHVARIMASARSHADDGNGFLGRGLLEFLNKRRITKRRLNIKGFVEFKLHTKRFCHFCGFFFKASIEGLARLDGQCPNVQTERHLARNNIEALRSRRINDTVCVDEILSGFQSFHPMRSHRSEKFSHGGYRVMPKFKIDRAGVRRLSNTANQAMENVASNACHQTDFCLVGQFKFRALLDVQLKVRRDILST